VGRGLLRGDSPSSAYSVHPRRSADDHHLTASRDRIRGPLRRIPLGRRYEKAMGCKRLATDQAHSRLPHGSFNSIPPSNLARSSSPGRCRSGRSERLRRGFGTGKVACDGQPPSAPLIPGEGDKLIAHLVPNCEGTAQSSGIRSPCRARPAPRRGRGGKTYLAASVGPWESNAGRRIGARQRIR